MINYFCRFMFIAFIAVFIFSNTQAFALYDNCEDVQELYQSLAGWGASGKKILQDQNALANRYEFKKQFTSGAGGASVFWVKDKNDGTDKVLKIFGSENFKKDFNQNNELREIFFTCSLEKIDDKIFPIFYDFGYTNTDNPFQGKPDNEKHFYYVMEFIPGKDLAEHAEENTDFIRNYDQVKNVLSQVVNGLKKAYDKLGFFHKDLHPGNIRVIKPEAIGGQHKAKIIDFGLATGTQFYQADGINAANAKELKLVPSRGSSLVLLNFIKSLRPKDFLVRPRALLEANEISKKYPHGDDLQFINMIIYGLRTQFDPPKFLVDYCVSYQDCIDKLK